MLEILERLRAAAAADRLLDLEIARAIGRVIMQKVEADEPAEETALHYTGCLDAAVELIPEGYFWVAGHGQNSPHEPLGGAQIVDPETDEDIGEGEAPTVPLAICIAALEARVALHSTHEPGCACPLCEAANAASRGANDH